MYEYIRGTLAEKTPLTIVIDVNGVGYKIFIPISHFGKLAKEGETTCLHTSWVVREMSQTLYGFFTKEERDLFEKLMTLSGIGPKTALNLIGHLEISGLRKAVQNQNVISLSKVPGIGKKTAERLMVDLRSQFKINSSLKSSQWQDALNALINLGYNQAIAEKAVNKAAQELTDESDLSTLIALALKNS